MSLENLNRTLENLPMLRVLLPLICGMGLVQYWQMPLWFAVASALFCALVALLARSQVWLAAALFLCGAALAEHDFATRPLLRDERVAAVAEIRSVVPRGGGRYRCAAHVPAVLDPLRGRWEHRDFDIMIYTDSLPQPAVESSYLFCARLHPTDRSHPAGEGFWRRGCSGVTRWGADAAVWNLEETGESLHGRAAERLRLRLDGGDAAGVVRAMVVADRSGVDGQLRASFSRSGMAHLLAVSGLHTGMVFLLLNLSLCWLVLLRLRLLRTLLVVAALWTYVVMTGAPPSCVRAAVMCTMVQAAYTVSTPHVPLNTLCAAAVLMLLWDPALLADMGFRLSFLAVAGIVVWGVPLMRRLRCRLKWVNRVTGVLVVGMTASLATLPLVSNCFGILPLWGVLLNPLVIPLAGVVVALGMLLLLWPFPAGGSWLAYGAETAAELLCRLSEAAGGSGWAACTYRLSDAGMAAVYLFFLLFTLALWCANPKKSNFVA